jgi:hypothetical protein
MILSEMMVSIYIDHPPFPDRLIQGPEGYARKIILNKIISKDRCPACHYTPLGDDSYNTVMVR